jgi:hypothetical protein
MATVIGDATRIRCIRRRDYPIPAVDFALFVTVTRSNSPIRRVPTVHSSFRKRLSGTVSTGVER